MEEEIIQMPTINEAKYRGEWLALDQQTNEVIAHGVNVIDVAKEAEEKGYDDSVFHPVMDRGIHLVTIE